MRWFWELWSALITVMAGLFSSMDISVPFRSHSWLINESTAFLLRSAASDYPFLPCRYLCFQAAFCCFEFPVIPRHSCWHVRFICFININIRWLATIFLLTKLMKEICNSCCWLQGFLVFFALMTTIFPCSFVRKNIRIFSIIWFNWNGRWFRCGIIVFQQFLHAKLGIKRWFAYRPGSGLRLRTMHCFYPVLAK